MSRTFLIASLICTCYCAMSSSASARTPQHRQSTEQNVHAQTLPTPKGEQQRVPREPIEFIEVVVLDQNGKKVRFYNDLIKGKVVAINYIYTSCENVCPLLTAHFAKLQKLMGDRLGKDFHLISISLDPVVDTPARLHAWANRFGARPGWTFVTGDKQSVDTALKPLLGGLLGTKEMHSPIIVICKDEVGVWKEVNAFAPLTTLLDLMEDMSKITTKAVPEEYSGTN